MLLFRHRHRRLSHRTSRQVMHTLVSAAPIFRVLPTLDYYNPPSSAQTFNPTPATERTSTAMALRNLVSKALFPNLDQQLHKSISKAVNTVPEMVDCMTAPTAFAYTNVATGAFTSSGLRAAPVKKMYLDIKPEGLFETALRK